MHQNLKPQKAMVKNRENNLLRTLWRVTTRHISLPNQVDNIQVSNKTLRRRSCPRKGMEDLATVSTNSQDLAMRCKMPTLLTENLCKEPKGHARKSPRGPNNKHG